MRRKFGRISKNKGERPKRIGTGKNIPNRIDIDLRDMIMEKSLVNMKKLTKYLIQKVIFVSLIIAGKKERWKILMD